MTVAQIQLNFYKGDDINCQMVKFGVSKVN